MSDPTASTLPTAVARGQLRRLARPFAALMVDKPMRAAVLAGVLAYVGLQVVFCVHVHVNFEGDYAGPFLFSKFRGVPVREAAAGLRVTEPHPWHGYAGWDSQFYYFVSNDLGMTRDAKDHIDTPSYRYQRVGVPMLAHVASKLLGHAITSPFVYHVVQLLLTAIGFGGLVYWLTVHGLPRYYAFTWLLAAGTIATLRYGMPDAPCDGLFILAFLGAYFRRLAVYVPAATLMCLGRETYVVFPFLIWAFTAANRYSWPGVRNYWLRAAVVAIPGVAVVAWAEFICLRLGTKFLEGSRALPWGELTDYPFLSGLDRVWTAWKGSDAPHFQYAVVTLLTYATVLAVAVVRGRRSLAVLSVVPFVVLLTMTGWIVWFDCTGFLKNLLPAVAFGVLLLPFGGGWPLRALLLAQLAIGADFFVRNNLFLPKQFSADRAAVTPPLAHLLPPGPERRIAAPRVTDHRLKISAEVVSTQDDPPYHGPWRWCHREPTRVRLTVENTSGQAWPCRPMATDYALYLGYQLIDESGRVVDELHYMLPRDVRPGERFEQLCPLEYQRRQGNFTARFGLVQVKDGWSFDRPGGGGCDVPVSFRSVVR